MALNSDMRITSIFILLLFSVSACISQQADEKPETKIDSIAAKLNDTAMKRYQNFILGYHDNIDSLNISLTELERAIELEPSVSHFYSNKANILFLLERDSEAIQVLKDIIGFKPDFAEALAELGFIYDRKGNSKIAQEWYQKALNAYDKRIEEDLFLINSKVNKAFLLFFTEDEKSAKYAFDKLLQEYPENEEVKFSAELFTDFNKEEYINQLSN